MLIGPDDLRRLHGVQLQLLKEFDRVCTQLGIAYQIGAGTLLGAIRHEGFIPWDDDADVIMRRADYELFLDQAPALLGELFFLQCWKSDRGFHQFFAKLRRNGSCFRQCGWRNDMHHGIFIDIFPFDPVRPEARIWRLRFRLLQRVLAVVSALRRMATHERQGRLSSGHPSWRRALGPAVHRLLAAVPWRLWPALHDALLRSMGAAGSDRLVCLASGWLTLERIRQLTRPASEFEQTVWLPFEGQRLPATAAYASALTRLYGDYRTPPPPKRRIPSHPVEEFVLPLDGDWVL